MSFTTTCGSSSRIRGRVSSAARAAAAYGFSGRSRVGNTWYSGAGANLIPSRSTSACHRLQVSSVTSWPRSTSFFPTAIAGNAWPGSPKAPTNMRSDCSGISLGSDLCQVPDHPQPVLLGGRGRGHEQGLHAGVAVCVDPVGDRLLGARERDLVDQLVRDRGHRLALLSREIEVLDLPGGIAVPVTGDELVV